MPTGFSSFCFQEGSTEWWTGGCREVSRLPGTIGQLTTGFRTLRDRDGGVWIGALGGGLAHFHDGRVDLFSQSDGLSSDTVAGLFQDREGSIWVATHGGLDRFRELPVTPFTTRQGFSNLRVLAVLASTDGSIWVRTLDGLNQWKDGHVAVHRRGLRSVGSDEGAEAASDRRQGEQSRSIRVFWRITL